MFIMTKSVLAMMIGFLMAIVTAVILIPILKKLKAGQTINKYLAEAHKAKSGTPTMGGLIFIIPTIITIFILFFMNKISFSYNLLIVIFTFLGYSLIGFIDDYLIIKRRNNKGLTEGAKMLMQIIIAIIFFYLFVKGGHELLLWIHTLGIKLEIGWLYGLCILFILVASSNAVNITDGLDGLAAGLSIIAVFTLGLISLNTGWLEGYKDISLFCFILVGSLLGFLIFNVRPAKVFMGDTGSLSLGAILGTLAILTRHELLLVIIGIVFVIETMTCIIQIFYYKLTHKRIFPMTPIHHTFEKMGWNESDIVKFFWIIGLLGSMIAITFGVWI
ncbi:MAG: phospho-N-acetylmuramoyl-pentapeptide-transferase [Ignavibacteriales bacterium]